MNLSETVKEINCIQQRWAVGDDMNTTLTYEEKKRKREQD